MRKQDSLNEDGLRALAAAALTMKNEEEMRRFLIDLCSVRELNSLSQRLRVAELLDEGKTYAEMVAATGASTAIVSRMSRALSLSEESGLELAVKRMKQQE